MQDFDKHKEELNETPLLRSLKKENIFRTPDDYFENLPGIWEGATPDPETPVLNQLEKKNIFLIPEGYFESLAAKIAQRTQKVPEGKLLRGGSIRSLRLMAAVAAAFALLIAVFLWAKWSAVPLSPKTETLLADISTEELMTGVDLAEVDLNIILEVVGDEAISALENTSLHDTHGQELNEILEELDISDLEGLLEDMEQ
ncbi:MAG: hypothetical protein R3C61_24075 [Bacteroidia bacterium]